LRHPTAIVDAEKIGDGTRIWAYSHVMQGSSIGKDCNIGEHCFIEAGAIVGNRVTIKNGNMVWDGVRLEDGVFVGPGVVFINDMYPRSPRLPQARERSACRRWLKHTVVKRGASLGGGAIILAGVTLGEFCMVGAGAIVTRSVSPYALVVGSPARRRGWVCRCGQPLVFWNGAARCVECRLEFINRGDAVDIMHSRGLSRVRASAPTRSEA